MDPTMGQFPAGPPDIVTPDIVTIVIDPNIRVTAFCILLAVACLVVLLIRDFAKRRH